MAPPDPLTPRTCFHCGYLTDHLTSDRCPECGKRIDDQTLPLKSLLGLSLLTFANLTIWFVAALFEFYDLMDYTRPLAIALALIFIVLMRPQRAQFTAVSRYGYMLSIVHAFFACLLI